MTINVDDQMVLDVGIGGYCVMIVCDIGRKLPSLDYEFGPAYVHHLVRDNGLKESTADTNHPAMVSVRLGERKSKAGDLAGSSGDKCYQWRGQIATT